jgi:hypothetical protein
MLMKVMLMKAMSTTGKSNTHTDRVTPAASEIRAAHSNPTALRSRRKPANRANLVSHASLGKPVNLANHVSPVQSNKSRPRVSRNSTIRNSTIRNSVKARDRQSSRRTTLVQSPLRPPTRVPQSPSSYGPRPRQATDATTNVS